MMMKKLWLLTSHRWYLFLIVMRKCFLTETLSVSTSFSTRGSILHQRKMKNKMDLKVMVKGIAGHPFLSVKKAAGSLDKELAASAFTRKEQVGMEKYIDEDTEGHDSGSDDYDDEEEVCDAVPIDSLKIDQVAMGMLRNRLSQRARCFPRKTAIMTIARRTTMMMRKLRSSQKS
ncbi:hypothetical protein PVAP13_5NG111300 [Panicum virgatum]|uniref:Uncharacterized protein n=1 Tax=Panicum virgatum TaxID=38727 RepID=A0A8T0S4A4_PANVG|nr:hypothetical protein PVAP13_5NG111300 [Panicum virgatum]